ncbi:HMGL-like domain-containing protein [Ditylenchus destructor]|nr:HMGL-like domain-containing protein [Ditylenchus destructor]
MLKLKPFFSSCFARCYATHVNPGVVQQKNGDFFNIVEVGPRDGLQNEKNIISTTDKIELIDRLSACGFKTVETTSFVSPKWVPQMADSNEVIAGCKKYLGVSYPVLVPNISGLKRALENQNVKEIAVFGAASETFTRKNTNCSMEESLQRLKEVTHEAILNGMKVRGYVSTVIHCPYEGKIKPKKVASLVSDLLDYGCYQVSLGDTTGVGSAGSVNEMLNEVLKVASPVSLAVHFHDTYGQALGNTLVALEKGIRTGDSSVAGLGGCPYSPGATGNLASEDLVYMLNDLGIKTGINLEALIETSDWICKKMGRNNASNVSTAVLAKKNLK